jgi:hypothetical protein
LQAVVDAAPDRSLVAGALSEILEGYKRSCTCVGGHKLRHPVVSDALLQVAAVSEDVGRLRAQCIGQRILEGEVCT